MKFVYSKIILHHIYSNELILYQNVIDTLNYYTLICFQFILEPVVVEKEGDLPVLFEPLIMSIRQERYIFIKDLHVWDYPVTYENMASFVSACSFHCWMAWLLSWLFGCFGWKDGEVGVHVSYAHWFDKKTFLFVDYFIFMINVADLRCA